MAALTNKERQARWRKRHPAKALAVGRVAQQKVRDTARAAKHAQYDGGQEVKETAAHNALDGPV